MCLNLTFFDIKLYISENLFILIEKIIDESSSSFVKEKILHT